MEINASTLSRQSTSLNNSYTSNDILQKSSGKTNGSSPPEPKEQQQVPEVGTRTVQGMIDIYA